MEAVRIVTAPGRRSGLSAPTRSFCAHPSLPVLLAVFFAASFLPAQNLPVLHNVRQVHTLTASEAARGYPVHLVRAQITYSQPSFSAIFLMDATDGIFANLPQGHPLALQAGDIVNVDAVTGPGDVAPVLVNTRFQILAHAPLPDAPTISLDRLSSGAFDSRWIAVEGVVRSVARPRRRTEYDGVTSSDNNNIILNLASGTQRLDVITLDAPGWQPDLLIDARVRLRAVAGARFNQRKQLVGIHLYMPNSSLIRVLEPAPDDPLSRPLTPVTGISRVSDQQPDHRVHVRGVVTSSQTDRNLSVSDAEHGIFVTTDQPVSLQPGDQVDVAGFPTVGDYTEILENAVVRRIGSAPLPAPLHLTPALALTGTHDAEPVELEGDLVNRHIGAGGDNSLRLIDSGISFLAVLPANVPPGTLANLQTGSRLRVRGICLVHTNFDKTPRSFDVLLRSPADVLLLRRPGWWNLLHVVVLAAVLAAIVLVIAAWNQILRRRVRTQTHVIRLQLEEAQALRRAAEAAHKEKSDSLNSVLSLQRELLDAEKKLRYQATHDALTGLWNRRALLELLEKELERCSRTDSSMGILMLDVDHFKPVNDSLGHLAGDDVLKEIARRISRATRAYDLSGRYGGEEFLIILPGCDREHTQASAERIRTAIASIPIEVAGTAIALTVSIGATVAPECGNNETEILALADIALYQAKSAGRNRTSLRRSFKEGRAEA